MYNFGLRLMSLSNTGNMEDLYNVVENNLNPLLTKGVYPVNDRDLFRDFIERFVDRYYSRYINFNTYGELFVKVKFVLENNKKKYQRIYELSLKEIDPLITFKDSETIKEDTTTTGELKGNSSGTSENTQSTTGETITNNVNSFEDRKDTTKFKPTGSEKTTNVTDDQKTIQAQSSNPKTKNTVPVTIEGMEYLDNEVINKTTNNFHVTNSFENRQDETTYQKEGKDIIDTTVTLNNTFKNEGNVENTSETNSTDIKDSLITRIHEGFNGNQMELLRMYENLVFDLNNSIIEDINRANIFMKTLA